MGKFINPFTDWGFKHIFGREVDKDILIEFLNDLLAGEHVITDLECQAKRLGILRRSRALLRVAAAAGHTHEAGGVDHR